MIRTRTAPTGIKGSVPDRPGVVGGLLLTGGRSSRLGKDKANLPYHNATLARVLGERLAGAVDIAIEVGDGASGLPHVRESPPGGGPLAAVARGWGALVDQGELSGVVVLACDLPLMSGAALSFLARHPSPATVIPVANGRLQFLSSRLSAATASRAMGLVASGASAMMALLGSERVDLVHERSWSAIATAESFADIDRPEDLRLLEISR